MPRTIVLAYSGGLDTSIIVPWLRENYDARVICVAVIVGQVAESFGVTVRTLHHYDAEGLVVPSARGVAEGPQVEPLEQSRLMSGDVPGATFVPEFESYGTPVPTSAASFEAYDTPVFAVALILWTQDVQRINDVRELIGTNGALLTDRDAGAARAQDPDLKLLVGAGALGAVGLAAVTFMRSWVDLDLVNLAILPLFLFSATFYPLDVYPPALQLVTQISPLYHGVTLIRSLTLGLVHIGLLWHVAYLLVVTAIGAAVAARRLHRQLAP